MLKKIDFNAVTFTSYLESPADPSGNFRVGLVTASAAVATRLRKAAAIAPKRGTGTRKESFPGLDPVWQDKVEADGRTSQRITITR